MVNFTYTKALPLPSLSKAKEPAERLPSTEDKEAITAFFEERNPNFRI